MKKKIAAGLAVLGVVLILSRKVVYGISFLFALAGAGCLGIALLLSLTGPYRNWRERRRARRVLTAIGVIVALLLMSFIWVEIQIMRGSPGRETAPADVLIVLGAGLRGGTPSATLLSRLKVTCDYMNEHPETVAILTGGQGSDETRTEAAAMEEYLLSRGIAPERLILEDEARNTAQNVKYSLALMEEKGLEGHVAVLSSEFHLYRARRIFARYDMDVDAIPAPTPRVGLVPLNSYLREYASVLVMTAKDIAGIDE